MIIALAGRRIDAVDAPTPRFPAARQEAVRQQLQDLFIERGATSLVCSGACGADLLALDVAGALGLRRRLVLPFEPERFRQSSVADRDPDGAWQALFDRTIATLAPADQVVLTADGQDDDAYAAANTAILDEATALAHTASGSDAETSVLAVIVWEGEPRGNGDLTAAFATAARTRGLTVVEVLTL